MSNSNDERVRTGDAGESRIRGRDLDGAEQKGAADHLDYETVKNTDTVIRTDGEPDTLYDDGLELEPGARPLTGINGKDDSEP